MNSSMFLPQVAEDDVFDANGNQVDDINSVIEYIQVALGYDHTADDEDDDCGQNFHLVKTVDFVCYQINITTEYQEFSADAIQLFFDTRQPGIQSRALDILTPPPDSA